MENKEEEHIHLANHNSCGLCCVKINNFKVQFADKVVLEDVNIHLHCGEITCIIGPNGAGKSTLLRAIIDMVKHEGTIEYVRNKENITKKPVIGYVPQKISVDKSAPISVKDLLYLSGNDNNSKLSEIIRVLDIESLMDKKIGDLSGGQIQKVLIALAMNPFPDILLLDEPVANIDKVGIEKVYKIISKLREKFDMAIIMISHDLEGLYNYADNVILLDKKVLVEGNVQKVYNSPEFKDIFGVGDNNG